MENEINVEWQGNMNFVSNIDGFQINLDAKHEAGGNNQGCTPKPLMLTALGGCTGMDVISILKKMKIIPAYFNVKVNGLLSEEFPKHYIKITLIYEFKGNNLPFDKIEKAVKLSIEKYCGVLAVYKKAMPVNYEIKINKN
ncbi:MAG: OsmC family protein [Bacteroidota bacterium]|nr:OsmC family protein [Bacteroidota bacterium]